MQKTDNDLIECYLTRTLKGDERRAFDERLANDTAFRESVAMRMGITPPSMVAKSLWGEARLNPEMMQRYLDNNVSIKERDMVEAFIKTNPEAQADLEELRKFRDTVAPIPAEVFAKARLPREASGVSRIFAKLAFGGRASAGLGTAMGVAMGAFIVFMVHPAKTLFEKSNKNLQETSEKLNNVAHKVNILKKENEILAMESKEYKEKLNQSQLGIEIASKKILEIDKNKKSIELDLMKVQSENATLLSRNEKLLAQIKNDTSGGLIPIVQLSPEDIIKNKMLQNQLVTPNDIKTIVKSPQNTRGGTDDPGTNSGSHFNLLSPNQTTLDDKPKEFKWDAFPEAKKYKLVVRIEGKPEGYYEGITTETKYLTSDLTARNLRGEVIKLNNRPVEFRIDKGDVCDWQVIPMDGSGNSLLRSERDLKSSNSKFFIANSEQLDDYYGGSPENRLRRAIRGIHLKFYDPAVNDLEYVIKHGDMKLREDAQKILDKLRRDHALGKI